MGVWSYAPRKFFKINVKILRVLGILQAKMVSSAVHQYITKITSIIGSDEILNRPHVCSQPPTTRKICLLSILSKAEVHLLVLRCLNLYSLKCIISLLNFRPVFLGAPLQLGAPSARLVRLWVNPALFGMKYDFRQWRKFALCF